MELPEEDKSERDVLEDNVGMLRLCLYGTREAVAAWQQTVIEHLASSGFDRSVLNPCVHSHKWRDIKVIFHGDDYVSSGSRGDLEWFERELAKRFEIKTTMIGEDPDLPNDMQVLNIIVRVTERGFS